jgi:hypothetical protein
MRDLKKPMKVNKKIILIILVVGVSLLFSYFKTTSSTESSLVAISQKSSTVINKEDDSSKPPVVDYFACGDYCPGPKENYMVKVYSGVTNPEECKKIGGIPSSFTGWGITHFCRVSNN